MVGGGVMKRWMVMLVVGLIPVGAVGYYGERERKAAEKADANFRFVEEQIAASFQEEMAKIHSDYAAKKEKIESDEKARKSKDDEDKRMRKKLPQGEYLQWRVDRNREEMEMGAAREKRQAIDLQTEQLEELRKIREMLGNK